MPQGPGLLHPVVHLHVFDRQGRLYLQKRAATKDIQPGKWDTAVGGHVNSGEQIADALLREAREELGIEGFQPEFLYRYIWESERESELVHTFMCRWYGRIEFDPVEIDEGRFWTLDQIGKSLGQNIFTPNFEQEFRLLRQTAASPGA